MLAFSFNNHLTATNGIRQTHGLKVRWAGPYVGIMHQTIVISHFTPFFSEMLKVI
jgi:hypothetical protein